MWYSNFKKKIGKETHMKKVIGILLVLALCIPLAACSSPGQIENVAISIENSEKFSMPEIQSAKIGRAHV